MWAAVAFLFLLGVGLLFAAGMTLLSAGLCETDCRSPTGQVVFLGACAVMSFGAAIVVLRGGGDD
jgi:hypothetical protein